MTCAQEITTMDDTRGLYVCFSWLRNVYKWRCHEGEGLVDPPNVLLSLYLMHIIVNSIFLVYVGLMYFDAHYCKSFLFE